LIKKCISLFVSGKPFLFLRMSSTVFIL